MTVLKQEDGVKMWFWINAPDREDIYVSPDNWSIYWVAPKNWAIASNDVPCGDDCFECHSLDF